MSLFVMARGGPSTAWASVAAALSLGCGARTAIEFESTPLVRQVYPGSTERLSSQQPNLRWELGGSADGARVELCRSRGCEAPELVSDVKGSSFRPSGLAPGVHYWRLTAQSDGRTARVQTPTWEFVVPARGTAVDSAWPGIFDIDGDGHADAVATPLLADGEDANSSSGCLAVYSGGDAGLARDLVLAGPGTASSQFGTAASGAGDTNGDGYGDLVVGAPCDPATPAGAAGHSCTGTGRVYVFNGGLQGVSARPIANLDGRAGEAFLGTKVAALGDVNGDGYGDFFATSSMLDPSATENFPGSVLIFLGSADGPHSAAMITGPNRISHGETRFDAASGGDLNGDGYDDLILSVWCSPVSTAGCHGGSVHVYLGGANGLSDPPFLTLHDVAGDEAQVVFGSAVAGGVDVNGDGYSDILVGVGARACTSAPCAATGRIDVYLGGPSGPGANPDFTWHDPSVVTGDADGYGSSILPLGDLNGDGFDDVAVNTPVCNFLSGAPCDLSNLVDVYLGGAAPAQAPSQTVIAPDHSTGANELFAMLRAPGDIDGDGFDDVIASAIPHALTASADLYTFRGTARGFAADAAGKAPWPVVTAQCR